MTAAFQRAFPLRSARLFLSFRSFLSAASMPFSLPSESVSSRTLPWRPQIADNDPFGVASGLDDVMASSSRSSRTAGTCVRFLGNP